MLDEMMINAFGTERSEAIVSMIIAYNKKIGRCLRNEVVKNCIRNNDNQQTIY